jgi:DNA-directed RNA polymerase specialized sigma24 family protein
VLRYFLQWNSREIAESVQMPEGTVRYRLLACRRQLAAQLTGWSSEGGQE